METCKDCGTEFERRGTRGPAARRCPVCTRAHDRALRRKVGKPTDLPEPACGEDAIDTARLRLDQLYAVALKAGDVSLAFRIQQQAIKLIPSGDMLPADYVRERWDLGVAAIQVSIEETIDSVLVPLKESDPSQWRALLQNAFIDTLERANLEGEDN